MQSSMKSYEVLRNSALLNSLEGFPGGASIRNQPANVGWHKRHGFNPWVKKIPQKVSMATHSSILTWRIP